MTQEFATWTYVQQCNLGQFIALVFSVLNVEDKWADGTGDPYAVVYGLDMDRMPMNALYLWRFEEGDVEQGHIYIARGLKVVPDTYWNTEQFKYVPRDDGTKKVECTWRTALEDVTHVDDIKQYF